MLETIRIENIALIREIEIDFRHGFEVLTGETGAGKSILIDSIGLLSGGKADKTLIRTGEVSATVSGIFSGLSSETVSHLDAFGIHPDADGKVIAVRTLSSDGKGKVRINGTSVPVGVLKDLSPYLIDIHGQSETLALYDSNAYLGILDRFSACEAQARAYREEYEKYAALTREMQEMDRNEAERARTLEMLAYQIADIDALSLQAGEDRELEEKELRVKNHERIFRQASFAYRALKGAEKGNASLLLDRSAQALESLADVIPDAGKCAEELRDCLLRIEDIAERAYDLADDGEGDPTEVVNRIEERLVAIAKLKKKYGPTVDDILAYRAEAERKRELLENADGRLLELKEALSVSRAECEKRADILHNLREKAALDLAGKVVDTLVFLDMPKVRFRIDVSVMRSKDGSTDLTENGYDAVDFLISANSGEEMHSLSKVASGGELARIMLALKSAENAEHNPTAMIFDEIDTGVSGKTARKIGIKLLELSRTTQIFCVTHSAQIASLADDHFLIAKSEKNGRTETHVRALDEDGRIGELSRILGGISVTDAQRQAAIDMRKEKTVLS